MFFQKRISQLPIITNALKIQKITSVLVNKVKQKSYGAKNKAKRTIFVGREYFTFEEETGWVTIKTANALKESKTYIILGKTYVNERLPNRPENRLTHEEKQATAQQMRIPAQTIFVEVL